MELALERLQREAAALPDDAQAELAASLIQSMNSGARGLLTSLLGAAVTPLVEPILEAGPEVYRRLSTLKSDGAISERTYVKAGMAWSTIVLEAEKPLPPAEVSVGDAGSVRLSWEQGSHRFGVEVFPEEHPNELFYENVSSHESWRQSVRPGEPLPRAAQAHIRLLRIPPRRGGALTGLAEGSEGSLFGAARPFIRRTPGADEDWDDAVARSMAADYEFANDH